MPGSNVSCSVKQNAEQESEEKEYRVPEEEFSLLESTLTQGLTSLGVPYDGRTLERYRTYFELLELKNRVMNLTAISGGKNVAQLHFLDCAALLGYFDFAGKKVIDVGTGAGFPGLALKIVCPEMKLSLLDSLDKRIGFLKETCAETDLEDVRCIHARAEEQPAGSRENYDFALSRAVARLNVLAELCLPYVRTGGCFIAMKSTDSDEEIREASSALKLLGGKLEDVKDYTIPGTDITHRLVVIRKVRETPKKYPRRWAQIKKQPLL